RGPGNHNGPGYCRGTRASQERWRQLTEVGGHEALIAIEEIKQLKARYFRYVDTKEWELLRTVFTHDCTFGFEGVIPGEERCTHRSTTSSQASKTFWAT